MKKYIYLSAIFSCLAIASCANHDDEPNDDNPNTIKPIDLEWQKTEYDPDDFEHIWWDGPIPDGYCVPLLFEYRGINLTKVPCVAPYYSEYYEYYGVIPEHGGQFTIKTLDVPPYNSMISWVEQNNVTLPCVGDTDEENLGPVVLYTGEWGEITSWHIIHSDSEWSDNYYYYNISSNDTGSTRTFKINMDWCNGIAYIIITQESTTK